MTISNLKTDFHYLYWFWRYELFYFRYSPGQKNLCQRLARRLQFGTEKAYGALNSGAKIQNRSPLRFRDIAIGTRKALVFRKLPFKMHWITIWGQNGILGENGKSNYLQKFWQSIYSYLFYHIQ